MTGIKGTSFSQMSLQDFMALGRQDVAYVKPIVEQGRAAYAIHTADGKLAAVAETRELAFATIRQNDLEPVSVN
jgi:hypothetical protein